MELRGDYVPSVYYRPYHMFEPINLLPHLKDAYEICRDLDWGQAKMVQDVAREEKPPSADSVRDVRDNCQRWCLRVVEKLVGKGLVEERWVEELGG